METKQAMQGRDVEGRLVETLEFGTDPCRVMMVVTMTVGTVVHNLAIIYGA